jgi:hypothetical protein
LLKINILKLWHGRWFIQWGHDHPNSLKVEPPCPLAGLKSKIMKKVTAIVLVLIASVFNMKAASDGSENYYGNYFNGSSYIFVEGGVEFSVFPDGQFDFVYVGRNQGSQVNVSIHTPNVSVSYNSGYNYDAFVQYDDYGAVIQIEDVPVYYDEFGRIAQAGSVEIRYNHRRIVRVGGMHVYYNHYGYYSHYSGYISPWYTTYVYRPWHVYYARPIYTHCVVYDYPYRRYYSPVRYSYGYHREHYGVGNRSYNNGRRDFYRPGSRVHYENGRTADNKNYRPATGNRAIAATGRNERKEGRNDYATNNTRPVARGGYDQASNANTRPVNPNQSRPVERTRPSTVQNNSTKERPVSTQSSNTKGRPATNQSSNTKGRPAVSQGSKNKPAVNKQQTPSKTKASGGQQTRKSNSRDAQKSGRG